MWGDTRRCIPQSLPPSSTIIPMNPKPPTILPNWIQPSSYSYQAHTMITRWASFPKFGTFPLIHVLHWNTLSLQTVPICPSYQIQTSLIPSQLVSVKHQICTHPTKSPWIPRLPAHSLAMERLQESVAWWQSLSLGSRLSVPWRGLVDTCKLYFSLHVNIPFERYVKQSIHTAPDKENIFGGWQFSGCRVCWSEEDTVYLGLAVLCSIPTAYRDTVQCSTVKVSPMYIGLISLPAEARISPVTLLHIFTLQ